jgi:hypothetical protein
MRVVLRVCPSGSGRPDSDRSLAVQLLAVAFDGGYRARRGLVGVPPGVTQGAPLADKVPGRLELELNVSEPVGLLGTARRGHAPVLDRSRACCRLASRFMSATRSPSFTTSSCHSKPRRGLRRLWPRVTRRPETGSSQISYVRSPVAPGAA